MRFLGPAARHLVAGGLLGLVVVLVSSADPPGYFSVAELKALDSQFDLRGPLPASSPIVIVSVDEGSNDELALGVAPGAPRQIPRHRQPRSARRHWLDLLFAEPSGRGPKDDAALAAGIKRAGNVVLAAALTVVREPGFEKEDLNPPIPLVREGAAGFGIANFETDADAFLRRATL